MEADEDKGGLGVNRPGGENNKSPLGGARKRGNPTPSNRRGRSRRGMTNMGAHTHTGDRNPHRKANVEEAL